jgi:hypothetical protein
MFLPVWIIKVLVENNHCPGYDSVTQLFEDALRGLVQVTIEVKKTDGARVTLSPAWQGRRNCPYAGVCSKEPSAPAFGLETSGIATPCLIQTLEAIEAMHQLRASHLVGDKTDRAAFVDSEFQVMTRHGDLFQGHTQDLSSAFDAHGVLHVFPGVSNAFSQSQPFHLPGRVQAWEIAEVLQSERQLLNGCFEVKACNEHS